MWNRFFVLLATTALALVAGCANFQTRNANLTEFCAAQSLELWDRGPTAEQSVKRKAKISDAQTMAAVNALLRSVASNWKPVPATAPSPRYTLVSIKNGEVSDAIHLYAPDEASGKAYIQMSLPGGGIYFTHIGAAEFDKILKLFGVPEWRENPKERKAK